MLHGNSRLICRKWRSARSEKTPSSPRGDGKEGFPIAIQNLFKDLPKESHFSQQFASFWHFKKRINGSFLRDSFSRNLSSGGPKGTLQHSWWGGDGGSEFALSFCESTSAKFFFPNGGEKLREIPPKYIPPNHSGLCYESVWSCSCPNFQRWWLFWSCKKPIDGSFELFAIDCFKPWCK